MSGRRREKGRERERGRRGRDELDTKTRGESQTNEREEGGRDGRVGVSEAGEVEKVEGETNTT